MLVWEVCGEIFFAIFQIVEYLQRPIYIWNKVSKHIMCRCGMDFQYIHLHIANSSQHFGSIQYVNGLSKSLPTFQVNNSKITTDLNNFPSFLRINGAITSYSIITTNYMFLLK